MSRARRLRRKALAQRSLWEALCREDLSKLVRALNLKADPNRPNRHGMPPLLVALRLGWIDGAKILSQRGARPSWRDALSVAAQCAGRQGVEWALRQPWAGPVDAASQGGSTALMAAARSGEDGAALALLAAGARTDLADREGFTALMWAVGWGSDACAMALARETEDLNARANGQTAAQMARAMRFDPLADALELLAAQRLSRREEDALRSCLGAGAPAPSPMARL